MKNCKTKISIICMSFLLLLLCSCSKNDMQDGANDAKGIVRDGEDVVEDGIDAVENGIENGADAVTRGTGSSYTADSGSSANEGGTNSYSYSGTATNLNPTTDSRVLAEKE